MRSENGQDRLKWAPLNIRASASVNGRIINQSIAVRATERGAMDAAQVHMHGKTSKSNQVSI